MEFGALKSVLVVAQPPALTLLGGVELHALDWRFDPLQRQMLHDIPPLAATSKYTTPD